MDLDQDIKIYTNDIDVYSRLSLSSGTRFINIPHAMHGYSYSGYAPSEPWDTASPNQLNILLGSGKPQHYYNSVGIGKISNELLQDSTAFKFELLSSENELEQIHKDEIFKRYVSKILNFFEDHFLNKNGLSGPLISFRHPHNLETATTNKYKKTYVGLHMDSWDPYYWRERHLARNRICINLGQEVRYFLFVNLTAKNIIEKIEQKYSKPLESMSKNPYLPHIFLDSHPKYKVVKLALKPGEYYIAPTENMIHDSTMIGKSYKDVFLTVWGNFNPSPII